VQARLGEAPAGEVPRGKRRRTGPPAPGARPRAPPGGRDEVPQGEEEPRDAVVSAPPLDVRMVLRSARSTKTWMSWTTPASPSSWRARRSTGSAASRSGKSCGSQRTRAGGRSPGVPMRPHGHQCVTSLMITTCAATSPRTINAGWRPKTPRRAGFTPRSPARRGQAGRAGPAARDPCGEIHRGTARARRIRPGRLDPDLRRRHLERVRRSRVERVRGRVERVRRHLERPRGHLRAVGFLLLLPVLVSALAPAVPRGVPSSAGCCHAVASAAEGPGGVIPNGANRSVSPTNRTSPGSARRARFPGLLGSRLEAESEAREPHSRDAKRTLHGRRETVAHLETHDGP